MPALRDLKVWELTQAEFVKISSQDSVTKSKRRRDHQLWRLQKKVHQQLEHTKKRFLQELLDKVLEQKAFPSDLFSQINLEKLTLQAHKDLIVRAKQEGWAVPWRVLQDYPELLKASGNRSEVFSVHSASKLAS